MLSTTLLSLALVNHAVGQTVSTESSQPTPTDHCEPGSEDAFTYVNVTGNLTIPAFTPPGYNPRNWTVNLGLNDHRNETSNSTDNLLLWIDSTDENEDFYSEDLPYIGCLVSFRMAGQRASEGSIGEGDGCKGVFSERCYNFIVEAARSQAEQFAKDGFNRNWTRFKDLYCETVAPTQMWTLHDCTEEETLNNNGMQGKVTPRLLLPRRP